MNKARVGNYIIGISSRESTFPLVALIFSVLYYYDTLSLPADSMLYAEPLIYIIGGLSVITIVIFGVDVNRDEAEGIKQETAGIISFAVGSDQSVQRTLQVLALIGLYILAIRIQFAFATIGFLAAGLYILGERRNWVIVVYSVSVTAVVYSVFIYWLNIPI